MQLSFCDSSLELDDTKIIRFMFANIFSDSTSFTVYIHTRLTTNKTI